MTHPLHLLLPKYSPQFHPVVAFDAKKDKLLKLDMTGANRRLVPSIYSDVTLFSRFVAQELADKNALYGIGGYLEDRAIYTRPSQSGTPGSVLSESHDANRTIHLGIDIWGAAGTPVYAPWGGTVHSFANNKNAGDYGATIILQHQVDGLAFYTLYGHLSLADLSIGQNQYIAFGEEFAHFGPPQENGNWPPHLHFQVIIDMELKEGDYPGVCHRSKVDYYQNNCPNPDLLLNMMQWT